MRAAGRPEILRNVEAPVRAKPPSFLRHPPLRRREIWVFLGLWLLVGYSLGTCTLVGPVRWAVEAFRSAADPRTEKLAVLAIIAVFVAGSAVLALVLTRIVARTAERHLRFGIPLVALAFAGGALALWLTPGALGQSAAEDTALGSPFTFGPYPTEERLASLKAEGYTAVVSLLHPAVAPFEPKLLSDEKDAAARVGIELVHLPMLPWLSENRASLDGVRELAKKPGRYYVHCYLGMDRVQLVRRVVAQTLGTSGKAVTQGRELKDGRVFERGTVTRIDENVFVAPFPSDAELMTIANGKARTLVSLLDPANADDLEWIQRESRLVGVVEMPYHVVPIPLKPFDPQRALDAARFVKTLPRPVVVHSFLAFDSGRAPASEAFVQAWRTDLPPLPPSLWLRPLDLGPGGPITAHVAAGPRPTASEFASLYRRGVRRVIYVGDPATSPMAEDAWHAQQAGLGWQWWNARSTRHLLDTLSDEGPWYMYGPRADAVKDAVARRFGGVIPEAARPRPERAGSARQRFVRFVKAGVPAPRDFVLLGPPLLLVGLLAATLAAFLRVRRDVRVPYTRKIFHFVIFTTASLLQIVAGLKAVCLFGGLVALMVLYAVWRGPGFGFYEAMARPTDEPRRSLFVLVPLVTTALGGVLANVFFAPFAPVAYLVGGWGDAVGEPVGSRWGRHRYKVPSLGGVPATRSLEGSAAVLLMGIAAAALGLTLMGYAPATALAVGAACGLAGALVEAVSNHGLDNLTVQVAAAATAFLLIG